MESSPLDDDYWQNRPIGWILLADGSAMSKTAMEAATEHCAVDPRDTLDVIHLEDPTKDYLPYPMTRDAIEEYFAVHAKTLYPPEKHYRFISHVKEPQTETRRALLDCVGRVERGDILTVGFVGRKGPKDDPQVLGSVTDLSLRASNMSCFIVKKKPTLPHTVFCVGVDGSQRSHDAATLALRLARPQDRVVLVHIEDLSAQPVLGSENTGGTHRRFDADEVSRVYTALTSRRPAGAAPVVFQRVVRPATTPSVSEAFLAVAEDVDAEVILVGVDGQAAHARGEAVHVGSNTDRIVRAAKCNVLVVARKGTVIGGGR